MLRMAALIQHHNIGLVAGGDAHELLRPCMLFPKV